MEVPNEVGVHNELLGLKGSPATLIRIAGEGYYEINLRLANNNTHRVLLPVATTVLIAARPEVAVGDQVEVER
jgi:hypothetical protein